MSSVFRPRWQQRPHFLNQNNDALVASIFDLAPNHLFDRFSDDDKPRALKVLMHLRAQVMRSQAEGELTARLPLLKRLGWWTTENKMMGSAARIRLSRYEHYLATHAPDANFAPESQHYQSLEQDLNHIISDSENREWVDKLDAFTDREALKGASLPSNVTAFSKEDLEAVFQAINSESNTFFPLRAPEFASFMGETFNLFNQNLAKVNVALSEFHVLSQLPLEDKENADQQQARENQKKLLLCEAQMHLAFCVYEMRNLAEKKSSFKDILKNMLPKNQEGSPQVQQQAQQFLEENASLFSTLGFDPVEEYKLVSHQSMEEAFNTFYSVTTNNVPVKDLESFSEKTFQNALYQFQREKHYVNLKRHTDGSITIRFLTGDEGNPYINAYHFQGRYREERNRFFEILKEHIKQEKNQGPAELAGHAEEEAPSESAENRAAISGVPSRTR